MLSHDVCMKSVLGAHDERGEAYVQRNMYMSMVYYFEQAQYPNRVDCVLWLFAHVWTSGIMCGAVHVKYMSP